LNEEKGLSNNRVYYFAEDNKKRIWIAANDGINIYEFGKITKVLRKENGLPDNRIRAILKDSSEVMWVGTAKSGISKFDGEKFINYEDKDEYSSYSLLEDSDKNIWIGTSGKGLKRFRNGAFESFSTANGLAVDAIGSLFEDAEKNLWVGTYGGGIYLFRNPKVTSYTKNEGLSSEMTLTIYEDVDNSLLIGTYGGGLVKYKDGVFSNYSTENGLTTNIVGVAKRDSSGRLWAGTYGSGINILKNGRFFVPEFADIIAKESLSAIFETSSGNMVLATFNNGVFVLKDDKLVARYTTANVLKNNSVRFVTEDSNKNLWIGTDGAGITIIKESKIEHITKENGLSNDLVFHIYIDSDKTAWIGTYGGGLNILKNNKIKSLGRKEGLFDDVIYSIVEDDYGNLWMSSNRGIFKAEKKALLDYFDGKIKSVKTENFGAEDGMKDAECNGGFQYAGIKAKNGKIYFATVKGLIEVDPSKTPKNIIIPPVYITKIQLGEKAVTSFKDKISLHPGTEKLDISYTSPSFIAPDKMRFKYMLEGFDKSWVDAETRKTAYYTNLLPGTYYFKVKAANSDGIWNEKGAVLEIVKQPFFYQTIWFYIVLALTLGLFTAILIRLRIRAVENKNKELAKLVAEKTTELRIRSEELESANKELSEIALKDPLTGLRNRRFLKEVIDEEAETLAAQRKRKADGKECRSSGDDSVYGIFMIDLDHFKKVNDNYGHDSGDMILKQLADIFRKVVRKDDIIARLGGEEFLIILRKTKVDYLSVFAEKLRSSVEEYSFEITSGEKIYKTCSIGFLQLPFYENNPSLISLEQAISLSDHALYQAKNSGRNKAVYLIGANPPESDAELKKMLASFDFCLENKTLRIV